MTQDAIPYAYTFDDVLLLPGASSVLPSEVDLSTRLTRRISLKCPAAQFRHGHRHRGGHRHLHGSPGGHRHPAP